jgi:hypothetical protein
MDALYAHLKKKNQSGIPYDDAIQLMLWLFCTLDMLPPELRTHRLGRQELANVFETLAQDGLIVGCPSGSSTSVDGLPVWGTLVDDFLAKRIALDTSFPTRAFRYV